MKQVHVLARTAARLRRPWNNQGEDGGYRQYVVYVAFVSILAVFALILWDDGFLSWSNLLNIGRQAAPIAVMAVGMAFALASAEIDLSIGSTVALSSLVAAVVVADYGFFLGALAAVTLGTLGIISGVARNMNNLQSMPIRNDAFSALFGAGSLGPISSLVIWTFVVFALGHFVLHHLRWGRHVLATGANRASSNAAGINTGRIRIGALMVSSVAASFAGVLLAGRLSIGRHDLGENDLLTVIAAVVIGGTSLFGGRASIGGAVTGALIMAMLNNGLILMGLEVADQLIARGFIIIVAVALSMRAPSESVGEDVP